MCGVCVCSCNIEANVIVHYPISLSVTNIERHTNWQRTTLYFYIRIQACDVYHVDSTLLNDIKSWLKIWNYFESITHWIELDFRILWIGIYLNILLNLSISSTDLSLVVSTSLIPWLFSFEQREFSNYSSYLVHQVHSLMTLGFRFWEKKWLISTRRILNSRRVYLPLSLESIESRLQLALNPQWVEEIKSQKPLLLIGRVGSSPLDNESTPQQRILKKNPLNSIFRILVKALDSKVLTRFHRVDLWKKVDIFSSTWIFFSNNYRKENPINQRVKHLLNRETF